MTAQSHTSKRVRTPYVSSEVKRLKARIAIAKRRELAKPSGICTSCLVNEARCGRTTCQTCADNHTIRQSKRDRNKNK